MYSQLLKNPIEDVGIKVLYGCIIEKKKCNIYTILLKIDPY